MPTVPPPPPPPPPGVKGSCQDAAAASLSHINIPKPRAKMKSLQWQKIPVNNVIGKSNIWTIIGHLENPYQMDYKKMEELFSLNHDPASQRQGHEVQGGSLSRKRKEHTEVNILEGKRSINVNIFLKQFRLEHEQIVQLVKEGRCQKLGPERLRNLLKLLPSQEEIDALNSYEGDVDRLGSAERFFVLLMKVPNYRMRTEGLLMMEEFNVNIEWILPAIEVVKQAAKDIQNSQSLKELAHLILVFGNYLNSGNRAGNAAGFKLSSLLQLTEIRANKPGMTLLHFLAQEAEEKNPKLLRLQHDIKCLKEASQVSLETLTAEVKSMASKVRAMTEQIVVAGFDFQKQMSSFLKEANVEIVKLEEDLKDIEDLRQELAAFFCEDLKTFKLEECFQILQTFFDRLSKAAEDNLKRQMQEIKAERRRQSRNQSELNSPKDILDATDCSRRSPTANDTSSSFDSLLADIRTGYTSGRISDRNINLTKVTKVNLSPMACGQPMCGAEGRTSVQNTQAERCSPDSEPFAGRPNRRSLATSDDASLYDILRDAERSPENDQYFQRHASLRFKSERRSRPSISDVFGSDTTRTRDRISETDYLKQNLGHAGLNDDEINQHIQLGRDSITNSGQSDFRRKKYSQESDESDALIQRLRQRLSRKSSGTPPTPITEQTDIPAVEPHNFSGHPITTSGVTVSMRKKISSDMGTDIDGVLKTIEDTGRQIDTVGVSGPIRRSPALKTSSIPTHPQVAIVANVTASSVPNVPIPEQDLKAKRDKRKKRSTLSVDDVKAAMKISTIPKESNIAKKDSKEQDVNVLHKNSVNSSVSTANSQQLQRLHSQKKRTNSDSSLQTEEGSKSKDPGKAAKAAAARRKFRDARFGWTGASNILGSSRTRSNVEYNSVNEALKEIACQSSMNRSKSYDEQVARKFLTCESDFIGNGTMRMKSGSQSETSSGQCAILRNSTNQLSLDGRRHGVYIPSDESDTELKPADLGRRKSFRHNSTKSYSQQSLKSINTSTETIDAESDLAEEHNLRNHQSLFQDKAFHEHASQDSYSAFLARERISTNACDTTTNVSDSFASVSPHHNQDSHSSRPQFTEEETDSPFATIAKWKMRRTQKRQSTYDNIRDNDSYSDSFPSPTHASTHQLKPDDGELRTEIGSRSSYASSSDRDEGFESASGTVSQRTSMNSEVEVISGLNHPQRLENFKTKGFTDSTSQVKPVVCTPKNTKLISGLSEEANHKERTEAWTQQNKINETSLCDLQESSSQSDDGVSPSNDSKVDSTAKHVTSRTPSMKTTKEGTVKPSKPKAIPSYMQPTSSSTSKPLKNKVNTTTPKSDSSLTKESFLRDSPVRSSTKIIDSTSTFKRTSVRASMNSEAPATPFQRGSSVRSSIRHPRSSPASSASSGTPSTLPNRARSDSISSTASSNSHISATPSLLSDKSKARLSVTSRSSTSTPTAFSRLSTPPIHHIATPKTPTPAKRLFSPASHSTVSSTPSKTSSVGLTRTQSMRVAPALGTAGKQQTSNFNTSGLRNSSTTSNRASTPSLKLPDQPKDSTPEGKTMKRLSFMAPTASSKAKVDESPPVVPPRTNSLHKSPNESPLSRSASLRAPKTYSGRQSPAVSEVSLSQTPGNLNSLPPVSEHIGQESKDKNMKKSSGFLRKNSNKSLGK